MTKPLSRTEIFAQASAKMRADFAALSVVPHNAMKGTEAERVIRGFLNGHLPKRFQAGAGFLLDLTGNVSPQTDVVVYDAFNCPVYRASEDASIFPTNNVAAVIEVKSRLDKAGIEDAAEKIRSIKSMTKARPAETEAYETAQTLGLLFAFTSDLKLETVADHYYDSLLKLGIGHHIDMIAVLDAGVATLSTKVRGLSGWSITRLEGFGGPASEGNHLAVSAAKFGDNTLDVFFRFLLTHLAAFRHIVDHPGFDFSGLSGGGQQRLRYFTSITYESDPTKRRALLKQYEGEVRAEFAKSKGSNDG